MPASSSDAVPVSSVTVTPSPVPLSVPVPPAVPVQEPSLAASAFDILLAQEGLLDIPLPPMPAPEPQPALSVSVIKKTVSLQEGADATTSDEEFLLRMRQATVVDEQRRQDKLRRRQRLAAATQPSLSAAPTVSPELGPLEGADDTAVPPLDPGVPLQPSTTTTSQPKPSERGHSAKKKEKKRKRHSSSSSSSSSRHKRRVRGGGRLLLSTSARDALLPHIDTRERRHSGTRIVMMTPAAPGLGMVPPLADDSRRRRLELALDTGPLQDTTRDIGLAEGFYISVTWFSEAISLHSVDNRCHQCY